jgi:hypothetical protein
MFVTPSAITTFDIDWYDDGNTDDNLDEHATCGNVTFVRPIHPSNAQAPMFVTLFGINTLVRAAHPENAYDPMLVIPSGIITLVRLLQPSKV